MKSYSASRFIWGLVYILGLLLAVPGFLASVILVVVVIGMLNSSKDSVGGTGPVLALYCTAVAFGVGMVLMLVSELLLAVVDTASTTHEILRHLREESARKRAADRPPSPASPA